jgi:conjugal transfer pilus assembly protein TrbC
MKKLSTQIIVTFMFCIILGHNCFANAGFEGINTNTDEISNAYKQDVEKIKEQINAEINNQNPNSNYNTYLQQLKEVKQQSDKTLFTQNKDVDEIMQGYYNRELTNSEDSSAEQGAEKSINQLLIFVSFSMPEQALKERVLEARKAGATIVLRGIIKDSITETAIALNKLTNNIGVNAIIDPNLYKAFDIKVVPTIVVAQYSTYPCEENCNYTPVHDKISGNISLDYALEQITNSKETITKPIAKKYLNQLRGGNNV